MKRALPARANLEHLKSQAKDLLSAYARGESEAFTRIRDALPAARGKPDTALAALSLALHDAQSVIAREYGFASWEALRAHVEGAVPSSELVRALMPMPLPKEVESALARFIAVPPAPAGVVPTRLPVIAVRNAVLTVGATAPFSIGRASSRAAMDAAQAGDSLLGFFAQKSADTESPTGSDLHPTGCAAQLLAVIDAGDRGVWIVARGTCWVRWEAEESREPCLVARVSVLEIDAVDTPETRALEAKLREQARTYASLLPSAPHVLGMVERMNALELADSVVAMLPCSVEDKARYASEPSLHARLERTLEFLSRSPPSVR